MKYSKAQVSVEFFVLVGMAFVTVIFFVMVSTNEIKEYQDQREYLVIKDLALKLQKEVTLASTVEDGYEREFVLPQRLDNNVDYFIRIKNFTITINCSDTVFSTAIPNITGDFKKGDNKIEKQEGRIYLNN